MELSGGGKGHGCRVTPMAGFMTRSGVLSPNTRLTSQLTSPRDPGEVDIMPKFPYQQLKVTVTGTAYYHDLGEFIAEF